MLWECTELGWGGAPPVEGCGFGGEVRLLPGCPRVGSLLLPQCQAKPVTPKPSCCAQRRGNSSARDTNWESSSPQTPLLVPRGGGTVASGPLSAVSQWSPAPSLPADGFQAALDEDHLQPALGQAGIFPSPAPGDCHELPPPV